MSRSRIEDTSIVGYQSARPDPNLTTNALYQHPNRRHFRAQEPNHISLATPVVRGVKSSELELDDVLVPPFEYGDTDAMNIREVDSSQQDSAKKIIGLSRRQSCA